MLSSLYNNEQQILCHAGTTMLEPHAERAETCAQQLTIHTRSQICYRRLVGAALHGNVAGGADGGARARSVLALAGLAVGLASVEVGVRAR